MTPTHNREMYWKKPKFGDGPISARRAGGFTLLEILCVVAIMGFMSVMIIASGVGVQTATDLDRSKAEACLISAGRDQYVREYQAAGRATWAAAATDQAKFALIAPNYLGLSSAATLTGYLPAGYSIIMGATPGDDITLWFGSTQIDFRQ